MSFKTFIKEENLEEADGRVAPGQWASSISHGKSSIEIERMIRAKHKILQNKKLSDSDRKWHQAGIQHLGAISTRMREQGKPTNEAVNSDKASDMLFNDAKDASKAAHAKGVADKKVGNSKNPYKREKQSFQWNAWNKGYNSVDEDVEQVDEIFADQRPDSSYPKEKKKADKSPTGPTYKRKDGTKFRTTKDGDIIDERAGNGTGEKAVAYTTKDGKSTFNAPGEKNKNVKYFPPKKQVNEVSKEKLTKYVHNAAMDQLSDKSTVSMKKSDAENDAALKRSAKRTAGVTAAVKKITAEDVANESFKDFIKDKKDKAKQKMKNQIDTAKFAMKNSDS